MRGGRRWRLSCAPWLPVNLHGLVRGYLQGREVVVKYAGGSAGRDFKGLYTWLYSRSNLWNLILDSLRELGNSAYTCRRSRMMWSCVLRTVGFVDRRRPTALSSRALLESEIS
ncbi:hypothetical protein EVAR_37514_1 [Eumeta japonica]|uniref:Uncharacterized protein n=1 Tax=Eumeta variegata TaxID=151549 RepID=A0A4C1X9J1_EUMVA|nr:hypothetical protein EVAR_37514_1 [Eumeta japonica]